MQVGGGNGAPAHDFSALLDGARREERWAFDALFEEWNRSLHSFVGARGVFDAEDVVSETFLGIFKSIGRFHGSERDFRSWVFRIARNKIADSHRRKGRQPISIPVATPPASIGGDVEDEAMARVDTDRVMELFSQLTDAQREVLLLRVIGDLTIDQVAEAMGRRSGAVKQLQRRALRQLERQLLDNDQESAVTPSGDSGDNGG